MVAGYRHCCMDMDMWVDTVPSTPVGVSDVMGNGSAGSSLQSCVINVLEYITLYSQSFMEKGQTVNPVPPPQYRSGRRTG